MNKESPGPKLKKKQGLLLLQQGQFVQKWKKTGSVENKPASDRPPKLTQRDVRSLKRIVVADRRQTLTQVTTVYNKGEKNLVLFVKKL